MFDSQFETHISLDSHLATTKKVVVKHKCQKASTVAMTKLQSLMNSDPITFLYSMEWIIPDVAKLLVVLGVEYKEFTLAALKAIWLPANNVDSEHLLSH
ncbi:hypothetical protein PR048_016568 [Dryococelus australis]|uniref:Uncharacterized protein n=1 Tax=Dryococelus australis TaxID=614101 RepID=A0ABQ9HKK8_9NEOP|nr:hypothetical protein PR048_016568 [Dryococelus australis]